MAHIQIISRTAANILIFFFLDTLPTTQAVCLLELKPCASNNGCTTAWIKVNDMNVFEFEGSKKYRGIITLELNPHSCVTANLRSFDTQTSLDFAKSLVQYIESLPVGMMLLSITNSDASGQLAPAFKSMVDLGVNASQLLPGGKWAFVAQIGWKDQAASMIVKKGEITETELHVNVTCGYKDATASVTLDSTITIDGCSSTFSQRPFYIVSEMNGKVLDVTWLAQFEGSFVYIWTKNNPPINNQLWYLDPEGYIHSVLNHLLPSNQANGQQLVMHQFSGNPRSLWKLDGKMMVNVLGDVVGTKGANNENATPVISSNNQDAENQHWHFEYCQFYIASNMNSKVLEIVDQNVEEGARLQMWTKRTPESSTQLWYFDPLGFVHSMLNDMTPSNGDKANQLEMQRPSSNPRSSWSFNGTVFVNGLDEVMDIFDWNNDEGAIVISNNYVVKNSQHWHLEYNVVGL